MPIMVQIDRIWSRGVPMEGDFAAPIAGASENNVYGGGISEISPDNIASITVLKGPNAAALYGERGSNGVILVTTKDGSGVEGLQVEYNANLTYEQPFVVPEFQDIYGGGNGYVTWYADGRNGGAGWRCHAASWTHRPGR